MLARVVEFGWAPATFLVVPVLVVENRPIRRTLSRSGRPFRDTRGKAGVASAGVGLLAVLAGVLGVVAIVVRLSVAASLVSVRVVGVEIEVEVGIGVGVGVVLLLYAGAVAVAVTASALGGVASGTLYLYAIEGRSAPPGVDPDVALRD